MKKIISTELLKLPRKTNYILLGILVILYAGLSFLTFSQLDASSSQEAFKSMSRQSFSLQLNIASLLITLFIIINIGQEYKNGTLRKNIIDGYSRNDFYNGKLLIVFTAVIFTFLLGIVSTLLAALFMGQTKILPETLTAASLLSSFIDLAYTALFATFLIFTFRKIAISIVLYFIWNTIEGIISGLQGFMINKFNLPESLNLQEYLPISSLKSILNSSEIIEPTAVVVFSIYVIIMLFLPFYLFKKADLKS